MAKGEFKGVEVLTPIFRAAWVYLNTPDNPANGNEPQYRVEMLFSKSTDLSVLKAAANQAATNEWGPDKSKWPAFKYPVFKEQSSKKKNGVLPEGYEEGAYILNAKSKEKPPVVGPDCEYLSDPESEIYSGMYAMAKVVFVPYTYMGNGITCYLKSVQKVRDGKRLFGKNNDPKNDFVPITASDAVGSTDDFGI